ncbi:MAG: hypothetical protein ACFHVJ_05120 [Aestuariibacter sp.]
MMRILLILGMLSCSAFAANETIPKDRIIKEISVYGDLAVISFTPSFDNSQNCSSGSKVSVQLNLNEDPEGVLYSTILSAAVSGKNIGFGIGGCNGQYPRVYRVDTKY